MRSSHSARCPVEHPPSFLCHDEPKAAGAGAGSLSARTVSDFEALVFPIDSMLVEAVRLP